MSDTRAVFCKTCLNWVDRLGVRCELCGEIVSGDNAKVVIYKAPESDPVRTNRVDWSREVEI